jgi:hypothetical protein
MDINSNVQVTISVSGVPSAGSFTMSPSQGSALNTVFQLSAPYWIDLQDNYPLTYTFGIRTVLDRFDSYSTTLVVTSSSVPYVYSLVLPSNVVSLYVTVSSSTHAEVSQSLFPTVTSTNTSFLSQQLSSKRFFSHTLAAVAAAFETYTTSVPCSMLNTTTLWSELVSSVNDTTLSADVTFTYAEATAVLATQCYGSLSDMTAITIVNALYSSLVRVQRGYLSVELCTLVSMGMGSLMNSNPSRSVSTVARALLSKLAGWGCGDSVFVYSNTTRFVKVDTVNSSTSNTRTSTTGHFLSSSESFDVWIPASALSLSSTSTANVRALRFVDPYLSSLGSLVSDVHELVVDGNDLPSFKLCNRFPGTSTVGECYARTQQTALSDLEDDIRMNISVSLSSVGSATTSLECQFYNTTTELFSIEGCSSDLSALEQGYDYVACSCNHATAFAVALTVQSKYETCASLGSWRHLYNTVGYKSWLAVLLIVWLLLLCVMVVWVIGHCLKRGGARAHVTLLSNSLLTCAAFTRVLYLSLLLNAWGKTDNIACVEFGYTNRSLPVSPENMNVIYDLFFPLTLTAFSVIFLYWYELCRAMHNLGKMKTLRFISGPLLVVRALKLI